MTAGRLGSALAALALAALAFAGCASPAQPHTAHSSAPVASATPTPSYLTELPEWAKASTPWLIYPDGFTCSGTEGCPNDYRAAFGEPGPVLPDGVEYYDPARDDCTIVEPAGVHCGR